MNTPSLSAQDPWLVDLAKVVERYQDSLPAGKLTQFPIRGLDRLPVSVHLADLTTPHQFATNGFGYGFSFEEARVSAFGELSETAHAEVSLSRQAPVEGSYQSLLAERGEEGVVDPLKLCLPAGSEYHPEVPLAWLEAKRYPSGDPVLIPWEFAAVRGSQMRGRKPLITPITNGLGAGLTLDQALCHGVLELLQRDGNCLCFRALDQGIVLDLDEIQDAQLGELITQIKAAGIELLPKLASTEFGLTNCYVVGRDLDSENPLSQERGVPIQVTACGEAVHLDREHALRKAVLEFAAARVRKAFSHGPLERVRQVAPPGYLKAYAASFREETQEARALEAMIRWCSADRRTLESYLQDTVLARRSTVPLSSLPSVPGDQMSPGQKLELLNGRLKQSQLDILYFDFSPADENIRVVKAVVPGLECETISYNRIGERGVHRLLAQESPLVTVGQPRPKALSVRLPEDAVERLGGPAWLDAQGIEQIVGELYPLYREPVSHAAQLVMRQRTQLGSM